MEAAIACRSEFVLFFHLVILMLPLISFYYF